MKESKCILLWMIVINISFYATTVSITASAQGESLKIQAFDANNNEFFRGNSIPRQEITFQVTVQGASAPSGITCKLIRESDGSTIRNDSTCGAGGTTTFATIRYGPEVFDQSGFYRFEATASDTSPQSNNFRFEISREGSLATGEPGNVTIQETFALPPFSECVPPSGVAQKPSLVMYNITGFVGKIPTLKNFSIDQVDVDFYPLTYNQTAVYGSVNLHDKNGTTILDFSPAILTKNCDYVSHYELQTQAGLDMNSSQYSLDSRMMTIGEPFFVCPIPPYTHSHYKVENYGSLLNATSTSPDGARIQALIFLDDSRIEPYGKLLLGSFSYDLVIKSITTRCTFS